MSTMTNKTTLISSPGIAVYPRFNTPDTKFNPEGVYKTDLRLVPPQSLEMKKLIDRGIFAATLGKSHVTGKLRRYEFSYLIGLLHHRRAVLSPNRPDMKAGIRAYDEVGEQSVLFADAMYRAGLLSVGLQNDREAIEYWKKALEKNPNLRRNINPLMRAAEKRLEKKP